MSDSEDSSEVEWEEVKEAEDEDEVPHQFPKEGINITLPKPSAIQRRGKKEFDPAAVIRREINRETKELQIDLHRVSLLCLLAQGMAYNKILSTENLFDLATTALKNKKSTALPLHVSFVYLEKYLRWIRSTFELDPELVLSSGGKGDESIISIEKLSDDITKVLGEFKVPNYDYMAMIFVLILRSMHIQARLIWSIQPISIRPSQLLRAPISTKAKEEKPSLTNTVLNSVQPSIKPEGFVNPGPSSKHGKSDSIVKSGPGSSTPTAKKRKANVSLKTSNKQKGSETIDSNSDSEPLTKRTSKRIAKSTTSKVKGGKRLITQNETSNKSTNDLNESKTSGKRVTRSSDSSETRNFTPKRQKMDVSSDSEDDFIPNPSRKPRKTAPKPSTSRDVGESKQENTKLATTERKIIPLASSKPKFNFWVEVFLEEEERWVSVDLIASELLCDTAFEGKLSQPISYVLAFGNNGQVKDVTRRYASQWLTLTQKLRTSNNWWMQSIRPFRGRITAREREEDSFLDQQVLSLPIPKSIQELKNHPLYILPRHLLKFEAIYPEEPLTLGYIKNEPFFSRECVKTLHAREQWLKKAKVVRIGEKPYKIVKSRPKYIRLTGEVIKDLPLELFGEWQVEDYIPPIAIDGKVPRNEYGNVNLFLDKMLPQGTVHLLVPGLQRVAKKLDIDCAPAVVGFDFHSGGCRPAFDGFVVCEEFKEILLDAWNQEQDERAKKDEEKRKTQIYTNWRKLIRGVLIRDKLEKRYSVNLGGKLKDIPQGISKNPPKSKKSTH